MGGSDEYDPYQQAAATEPRAWSLVPQQDNHEAISPLSPDAKDFLSPTDTAYAVSPIQHGQYSATQGLAIDTKSDVKTSQTQTWPTKPRRSMSILRSWWREILSAVLSVLCLLAIALILFKIDGILLSSWSISVSPNAVISILSTAAKAAMILPVAESISQLKWLDLNSRSR